MNSELIFQIQEDRKKNQEILSQSQKDLLENSRKKKALLSSITILKEVDSVLKELQEFVSRKTVVFLGEFLTSGVKSVYADRDFKIVPVVGDRGTKKTLTLFVEETIDDETIRSHITEASGGGIQVIVSFLIQVLVIMNYEMVRIIVLDEALTAVSSEYLDGLFDLIESLIDRFDFAFLLVTQDPRFIRRSTKTYKLIRGVISDGSLYSKSFDPKDR